MIYTPDYKIQRLRMVEYQIERRGIKSKSVLEAIRKVHRHRFIDESLWSQAYGDHPLPIGEKQTISQPYIVALMTEALELSGNEKVLEIGTGSGYQTAILAELADRIFSIERIGKLSQKARNILDELGYSNVIIRAGDGTKGWKEYAPFDRIIVAAGAPSLPNTLFEQLNEDGILIIPIGDRIFSQQLQVIRKKQGRAVSKNICACVFVPLIGDEGWEK